MYPMPKGCVSADTSKIQKSTLKSESLCVYLDLDQKLAHATPSYFFYTAVFMFYLMLCAATLLGVVIMASHALVRIPNIQNSKSLLWVGNALAWPVLLLTAIEAGGENNLAADFGP